MELQQFITFVLHHWALWLLFALLIGLLAFEELKGKLTGSSSLSLQQATAMMSHEEAVVLDIRDSAVYQQGHILGAVTIPGVLLANELQRIEKHKNAAIIVVCNLGQSAVGVAAMLRKQGFSRVYTLDGGMSAWKNAGLPSVKE